MQTDMSRRKQLKPAKLGTSTDDKAINEHDVKEEDESGGGQSGTKLAHPNHVIKQERPESVEVDVEVEDTTTRIKEGIEYGPFPAIETNGDDDAEMNMEIVDTAGNCHHFTVGDELSYQWLKQLNFTSSQDRTNCSLLFNGNSMKIVVTRDTDSLDSLLACYVSKPSKKTESKSQINGHVDPPKRFICNRCKIASFNSKSNLEAHQTYYCKPLPEKDGKADSTDSIPAIKCPRIEQTPVVSSLGRRPSPTGPVRFRSPMERVQLAPPPLHKQPTTLITPITPPPNAILLPVAFSSQPRVHVLGHPQVIIPVAVPKNSHFPVGSLILEQCWTNGIEMPLNRLPLGSPDSTTTAPFALPLGIRRTTTLDNRVHISPGVPSPRLKTQSPMETEVEDIRPLDLTVKQSPQSNTLRTPSPAIEQSKITVTPVTTGSVDKPFVCVCGISFSSLHTLRGHQQFYCRANSQSESNTRTDQSPVDDEGATNREPNPTTSRAKPNPCKCHYCGYIGQNSTQLSQHLRSIHSAIQGYLCQLCGYKGYSVRGMKSHMRSHTEITTKHQIVDELILSYVTTLTAVASPNLAAENGDSGEQEGEKSNERSNSASVPPPTILCQQCHNAFSDMDSYDRHSCVKVGTILLDKSSKSNENDGSESSEGTGSTNCLGSESPGRYSCQFCNYRSPYKGNMKRHLQLIHKMESVKDD